jgi:hypothetical protein
MLQEWKRPHFVVLGREDYRQGRGTRRSGTLATMSDEDFTEFRLAVEIYAAEDDD